VARKLPTPIARTGAGIATEQDRNLHQSLGTLALTSITLTGVIGSGWLFAAYDAAKVAGPASLVSWVIAAFATLLVALVFIDLSVRNPLTGGNVRWPQMASGPLVGAVIGWAIFLQAIFAVPSEATALAQYADGWMPGLVANESLTWPGKAVACAVLAIFSAVNLVGIRLVAQVNNFVTALKLIVPVLAAILLLASGFDTANYEAGGGFAPAGFSAALTAVIGSGMIYSFTGINAAAVLSGEARNAQRTVPRATFIALAFSFALYFALQLAVLFATPTGLLGTGWQGLNLQSPLAQLAQFIGLMWLSWLLLADAVFSPAGTMLISAGVKARYTYGAAQNGVLPATFATVHRRSGIPRRALLLNFVFGVLVIVVFGSWDSIASALSFFYGLSYAAVSVAACVFYATKPGPGWLGRWTPVVGAASFVTSGLILYWSTWQQVYIAMPLLLLGLGAYLWRVRRGLVDGGRATLTWGGGLWLVALLLVATAISYLGTFGGIGVIPAPADSLLIAVLYLYGWKVGCNAGIREQGAPGLPGRGSGDDPNRDPAALALDQPAPGPAMAPAEAVQAARP